MCILHVDVADESCKVVSILELQNVRENIILHLLFLKSQLTPVAAAFSCEVKIRLFAIFSSVKGKQSTFYY